MTRDELWARVAEGLGEPADALMSSNQLFGHPDCTHVVMGAVWRSASDVPRFVPLRDPADERSERDLEHFFERFGGLSFRDDTQMLREVHQVDMMSFLVTPYGLGSPPLSIGAVPSTERVFVSQEEKWHAVIERIETLHALGHHGIRFN